MNLLDTGSDEYNTFLNQIGHLEYASVPEFEAAIFKFKQLTDNKLKFPHLAPRTLNQVHSQEFLNSMEMFADIVEREGMRYSWPIDQDVHDKIVKQKKLKVFGEVGS